MGIALTELPFRRECYFSLHRGSNYTYCQFAATLKRHGLRQSAGVPGICYDNAMAESFFAALEERARLPHPVSDSWARAP